MTNTTFVDVNIDDLEMAADNVRSDADWEGLEGLAQSIAEIGLLQPITVQPPGDDGKRVIVTGARRMGAIDLIRSNPTKYPTTERFDVLRCIEAEYVSDADRIIAMVTENLQREDISPVDEARAYARLVDECGWLQSDIAKHIGRNKGHISKRLSLLVLPDEVLWFLTEGDMTMEQALALTKLGDHPDEILRIVGDHGRFSTYDVDQALGKMDRKKRVADFADRIRQSTDVPVFPGGKVPKSTGTPYAPMARAVLESAWDGTVPEGVAYAKVAMESWEDEPGVTFFTNDVKRIDTKAMTYDQRQKYHAAVAKADVAVVQADPKLAAKIKAEKRQEWIDFKVKAKRADHTETGLRQLCHKPTIEQILTMAKADADDLFANADGHEVAAMLGIKGLDDVDGNDVGYLMERWVAKSATNARRFTFAVLLRQAVQSGYPALDIMLGDVIAPFDEERARAEAEAELDGQDPD